MIRWNWEVGCRSKMVKGVIGTRIDEYFSNTMSSLDRVAIHPGGYTHLTELDSTE